MEHLITGELLVFRIYDDNGQDENGERYRRLLTERVVCQLEGGDQFIDVCINLNNDGFPEVYPRNYIDYLKVVLNEHS